MLLSLTSFDIQGSEIIYLCIQHDMKLGNFCVTKCSLYLPVDLTNQKSKDLLVTATLVLFPMKTRLMVTDNQVRGKLEKVGQSRG